ncbi:RibD family protein [Alphaproteobacteria bacterium]|nr:RibD family protein [Alphaproteobacteria bacterium]
MINTNNIADLFNFIKNHEKNNSLIIKITKNKIKIVKNKKNADLIINNKCISVNKNIDLILRECCEIIIPLLLKNNCNFIGQIGQSLDGKIALNNGNSHYINEKESIVYLHCLRSISDGVLVGVNTIIKDDPFLTTRKIKGNNPVRLIIDPSLKLTNKYNIFKDNNKNIIFTNSSKEKKLNNTTIVKLPKKNFTKNICKYLKKISLKTVLIEGGPTTLSHFIELKLLNYMQFIISPTIIGSGIDSIKLKPIENLKNAIRTENTITKLGREIIVTLDFNS